ncbi:MAG: type II secretion system minor pseudopilin GspI [Gammaproteobacteria bacterium]|nr:type II secretion system minor pseudopilin GspI [Gammaproteobacteria bacterium]
MRRQHKGFTLIEILVALVFIALPMTAIIQTVSNYVYEAAYLKEKTVAHWVAMNKLTELQVTRQFPKPGTSNGETLMIGEAWRWEYTVNNTPEADMRRVDINVFAPSDKEAVLTSLTAYLGKP